jgi:hypothetical protein
VHRTKSVGHAFYGAGDDTNSSPAAICDMWMKYSFLIVEESSPVTAAFPGRVDPYTPDAARRPVPAASNFKP